MSPSDKIEVIRNPENALVIYDRVFTARTGHDIYFTPNIKKKGLFTPVQFTINKNYVHAFLAAVHTTGEEGFYISMTERGKDGPNDWYVPLRAVSQVWGLEDADKPIEDYRMLENAIYSVNGKWGFWFSDGDDAIIGGSKKFVDTFYGALNRTIDEMVLKFLHDTRNFQPKARNYIIEEYLPKLFGRKEAEEYLETYNREL